jgi:ribosome biogenesis protein MAK21
MGKKRTHAETTDGFTKPPPDKNRTDVKGDKKDKRKNGEHKARSALVGGCDTRC